jgi:HEAT repeat protein
MTRYDAMVAVVKLQDSDALDLLQQVLATDDHDAVRKGALSCMTVLKKKPPEVIPLLISGLEDGDEGVRDFAAKLLRKGTNQEFYFSAAGHPDERAAAVLAWRTWYEKHKDRLYWDEGLRRFEIRTDKEAPAGKPTEPKNSD